MSSINVRKFVKEFKPIEIKEPFKTDVIEFNNTDDFTKYYREHEDEFSNISTYKLNVKYKIPGYKISQRRSVASLPTTPNGDSDKLTNGVSTNDKKEIILIKDYHYKHPSEIDANEESSMNVVSMLAELEKRISNIEIYLASD